MLHGESLAVPTAAPGRSQAEHSLGEMRTALALYRSAESGQWESVWDDAPAPMLTQSPIIDTHQHLWDLSKLKLGWLETVPDLQRSYTPEDYRLHTEGLGIERTVYAEVEVDADQKALEVEVVSGYCDDPALPTAAMIASADPATLKSAPPAWLDSAASVRAVRWGIHFQPQGVCLGEEFVAGVQALGEKGKAFEICIRPAELADAAALARAAPGTQMVLCHCGNADPTVVNGADPGEPPVPQPQTDDATYHTWHTAEGWKKDITALAACPNVVCKLSGIISRVKEGWSAQTLLPTLNYCIDAFGADRCMFGGDWPLCTLGAGGTTSYADWARVIRLAVAPRSMAEQRKILYENAVRVYGL